MQRMRKKSGLVVIATLTVVLGACSYVDSFIPKRGEETDVVDRQQNLSIEDFRKLSEINKDPKIQPEIKATAALGAPPVPDIAQVLAAPHPPKVANTKLVTLSVTEDVPLRDVLFELGRLANVDIEVGSGLDKSGINLRATDRPFNEVIERIAELGHLRYSVSGNSIRVEKDVPYLKTYSLDFLNIVRSSTSGYTLSTNILSSGGGGGGGSSGGTSVGTSGSTSGITSNAESDLWTSLDASISEILKYKPGGDDKKDDAAAAPAAAAGGGAGGSFVINRQAGVLAVTATEAQQEMIQRFLALLSRNSSAQVLIEAKIVEVALSDQFQSGINWTHLLGKLGQTNVSIGNFQPAQSLTNTSLNSTVNGSPFSLSVEGGELDSVLKLTQYYGTTRTLSSPRLSAINNQQAVLTFARNTVFFDCTVTASTTTSTTGGVSQVEPPTVNCTQSTVPIGIILTILPSINLDTQQVTLNVRPTLTRQVGLATNPESAFIKGIVHSQDASFDTSTIPDIEVPIIEVRELDSITKVKSGGVMVIGGLMQDQSRNELAGVPGMQDIPLIGNAFKSRSEDSVKTELIIFIKATIVNPDGSSHPVDRAVYDKFTSDPRPLFPQNGQ